MTRREAAYGLAWATLLLLGCASGQSSGAKSSPSGIALENRRPFLVTDINRKRAACVFFVGTDCPISNAYAPEIGRIIHEYEAEGVSFYIIYADRELQPDAVAEHAKAFGFGSHLLLDPRLELAGALAARYRR